jgi:hypothetical protein
MERLAPDIHEAEFSEVPFSNDEGATVREAP